MKAVELTWITEFHFHSRWGNNDESVARLPYELRMDKLNSVTIT